MLAGLYRFTEGLLFYIEDLLLGLYFKKLFLRFSEKILASGFTFQIFSRDRIFCEVCILQWCLFTPYISRFFCLRSGGYPF